MTLDEATAIAAGALAKAREESMNPMAVAVVDEAGTVKCLQTEDECALMRPDIAYGKAWGCIGLGFSTRAVAGLAQGLPQLLQAFMGISGNRLVPSPGGVMIVRDERVIGAVGVSGDPPDKDEACALAGIESADLSARL